MKSISTLLLYFLLISLAQSMSWFQLNIQFLEFKWKDSYWLLLSGIPVTWLYIKSVKLGVAAFDGQMWPQRLIQFAIGIIMYTILTYYVFGETFNLKNSICLGLSVLIVLIQMMF